MGANADALLPLINYDSRSHGQRDELIENLQNNDVPRASDSLKNDKNEAIMEQQTFPIPLRPTQQRA